MYENYTCMFLSIKVTDPEVDQKEIKIPDHYFERLDVP